MINIFLVNNHLFIKYGWLKHDIEMIMSPVNSDGHVWGKTFNWYCFIIIIGVIASFFIQDLENEIFELQDSRSMSQKKSIKIYSHYL